MISEENGFLRFLKGVKGKGFLVVLLIIGVAMLVIGGAGDGASKKYVEDDEQESLEECRARMENELETTLERIDGVGTCKVTITLERGERVIYSGSNVAYREPASVMAVSVSCSGGGSATVRREISETVAALFSIGTNRVTVHKLVEQQSSS